MSLTLVNASTIQPGKAVDLLQKNGSNFELDNKTFLSSALVYLKDEIKEDVILILGIYEADTEKFIKLTEINLKELGKRKCVYQRAGGNAILSKKAYIAVTTVGANIPKNILRVKPVITKF